MIVLLHVLIALTSVAFSTYLYISPSVTKLKSSYGLVASTLISGTYLVVSTKAHMLQACMTGLLYCGFVFAAIAAARRKLAVQVSE
ncbi:MAG: hypothetical protein JWO96_530 [Candidatus Saccharibacteria bacterium]|nr:hypothetical protein [Candidatus Saccharibacteria bacterium]